MKNRTWKTVSPRTWLHFSCTSQPQIHWRWSQAKHTPSCQKAKGKSSQKKWREENASAIYLLQSAQDILLSKERTSFKLLWKSQSWRANPALEAQCQPRQSSSHQPQEGSRNSSFSPVCSCVWIQQWWFPVSDWDKVVILQSCPRADQSPAAPLSNHYFLFTR